MLTCPSCSMENPSQASFCMACAAPLGAPVPSRELRKTVTALFCDLVGSTTLGETHDPEVLRPILERYFNDARSVVELHGGRVEKFIGDAVVATFGAPVAHEDDGLRAVRAAVEIHERLSVSSVGSPIELAARIGVTTGEVFMSDAEMPMVGDVMNTASRLQSAADPGEVLIGEPTWRLVHGAVTAEAVDPVNAKGKAAPVAAWRIISVDAMPARRTTQFVGRERYMSMLDEALTDATNAGAGVLATILAAPGVGKSSLATAFATLVQERATVVVGQTPSYGEGVTFAPLVELLSQAVGLPTGEAEDVAQALRDRLATQPDGPSVAERIAQLLGVGEATGGDTSWAVRRVLEVLAAERPLVVIFEDVHWAEPPMLDLVDAVVDRVHGPVLVLCLSRPELLEQRPTWGGGKLRAVTATLPPLSRADTVTVAGNLLGPEVPASVLDRICETAEGNPLYLEQLTAMLLDSGLLVDGRWVGSSEVEVEIPATLHALLTARLDRLDPLPRLMLERASVEGRHFRMAALLALAPEVASNEMALAIASLERSGFVDVVDETAGRWRISHALVVEAAYHGLSKALRAELHERLAVWMLDEASDQGEVDELVARHLERSLHLREELGMRNEDSTDLATRAGVLFAAAGLRAFAAVDLITSRDLLGRAAVLLPDRHPSRLDMLPNLGVTLTETGRPEETEILLAKAVAQSRAAGSERDALRATIQLLSNRIYRSTTDEEIDAAVTEAEAAADALEALDDNVGLAEAAITLEYLEFTRGCLARSHLWTVRALRHALATGHVREASQAAADIVNTAVLGPLPLGSFAAIAEQQVFPLDGPISGSTGHALMAISSLGAGDEQGFLWHGEQRRAIVERNGLIWLGASQELIIAQIEIRAGDPGRAERRLREAREVFVAVGDLWWNQALDAFLCLAVATQGRRREFLRLADVMDASTPAVADRHILVRRSLVRARALLLRGSAADAEAAARRGLELVESTDLTLDHADTLLTLADTLDARGQGEDATSARSEAAKRLRAKQNVAALAKLGL